MTERLDDAIESTEELLTDLRSTGDDEAVPEGEMERMVDGIRSAVRQHNDRVALRQMGER